VEDLMIERSGLRHADRIRSAAETALASLSEGEASAADRLGEAARAFAELASIDPREKAHRDERRSSRAGSPTWPRPRETLRRTSSPTPTG
jgi:DNA repair ATPase RecN